MVCVTFSKLLKTIRISKFLFFWSISSEILQLHIQFTSPAQMGNMLFEVIGDI